MATNYQSGRDAEKRGAEYLRAHGFSIRELNWKTRYCEIDIVAEKDKRIYFVEVKYRRDAVHGTGLEYLTPKKLKQMSFAAEMWIQSHNWSGEYQLAAISIDAEQITFLDEVQ